MKVIITILMFVGLSCLAAEGDSPAKKRRKVSEKQRETKAQKADQLLLESSYNFSIELAQEISRKNPNKTISISTPSILFALAMAMEGFTHDDKIKFLKAMGLYDKLNEENIQNAIGRLSKDLSLDSKQAQSIISNAVVTIKPQDSFSESFVDNIVEQHGGQFIFANNSLELANRANSFVSANTNGMIKEIISQDSAKEIIFTILNAIYFKANWQEKFKDFYTHNGTFTNSQGEQAIVRMMYSDRKALYNLKDEVKMISLPFQSGSKDKAINFVALLPGEKQTVMELEQKLSSQFIAGIIQTADRKSISISLPKIEIETSYDELKEYLEGVGVSFAGGIEGNEVGAVIHKTKVKVDESGAEAAAATAVVMREAVCINNLKFNANRPFIFLIMLGEHVLFKVIVKDFEGLEPGKLEAI